MNPTTVACPSDAWGFNALEVLNPPRPPEPAETAFENSRQLQAWATEFQRSGVWNSDAWRMAVPALAKWSGWPCGPLLVQVGRECRLHAADASTAGGPGTTNEVFREADLFVLRQGPDACSWTARAPGGREHAVVSVDSPGDNCLLSILSAWADWCSSRQDRGGFRPPTDPSLLRRAIADVVLEGVERLQRPSRPAPWIQETVAHPAASLESVTTASAARPTCAPQVPQPQGDVVGRAFRQVPAGVSPQNRITLAHAYRALWKGDVEWSCKLLLRVVPSAEIPHKLLRLLCAVAVQYQQVGHVVSLFEQLGQAGDLLLPTLGMDKEHGVLDLHASAVLVPFPDGHENAWPPGGGLTSGMASVLFELHARRGDVKPGAAVVVGFKGLGILRRVIVECIQARGWAAAQPIVGVRLHETTGRLLITHAGQSMSPKDCRIPFRQFHQLERLRQQLDTSFVGQDCLVVSEKVMLRLNEAIQLCACDDLLAFLAEYKALPIEIYRQLAIRAVINGKLPELPRILGELSQRFGCIPLLEWRFLLLAASSRYTDRWATAEQLLEQMVSMGYKPGAEHLAVLLNSATTPAELLKAVERYELAVRQGMPDDAVLVKTLLRRSMCAGESSLSQRFGAAVTRRGLNDDPHVRQSHIAGLCKKKLPDQAWVAYRWLRDRQVPLELECLKMLVETLWEAGSRQRAGDVILQSVERDEQGYSSPLGWTEASDDAPPWLFIHPLNVYHQSTPVRAIEQGNLRYAEALALLHVHGRLGHLCAGMRLQMAGHLGVRLIRSIREGLREFGLGMRASHSQDGVVQPYFEVIALNVGTPQRLGLRGARLSVSNGLKPSISPSISPPISKGRRGGSSLALERKP